MVNHNNFDTEDHDKSDKVYNNSKKEDPIASPRNFNQKEKDNYYRDKENPTKSIESHNPIYVPNPKRLKEDLPEELPDTLSIGVLPGLNKLKEDHSFPISENKSNHTTLSADELNDAKIQLVGLMYEYSNITTLFFENGPDENLLRGNSVFVMSSLENSIKDTYTKAVNEYTKNILEKIDQLQLSDDELMQIKFTDFANKGLPTPPTFYEIRGTENNFNKHLSFFPLVDEDLFKNEHGWQGINMDEDIKPIDNLFDFKNNLTIYLQHEERRNFIRPN